MIIIIIIIIISSILQHYYYRDGRSLVDRCVSWTSILFFNHFKWWTSSGLGGTLPPFPPRVSFISDTNNLPSTCKRSPITFLLISLPLFFVASPYIISSFFVILSYLLLLFRVPWIKDSLRSLYSYLYPFNFHFYHNKSILSS